MPRQEVCTETPPRARATFVFKFECLCRRSASPCTQAHIF